MTPTLHMAWRAAWRNLGANVMHAMTLAAVLFPLLVLFGLRTGVVEGLVAQLEQNPSLLEIIVTGHDPISDDTLSGIWALPEIGFAVGAARSLAAEVDVSLAGSRVFERLSLEPTGSGDPLLEGRAPLMPGEIALSVDAADDLGVGVGADVILTDTRSNPAADLSLSLTVAAIVPNRLLTGRRALVVASVLDDVSAFSDGYAVPSRGVTTGRDATTRTVRYDRLRVFAASKDDVPAAVAAVKRLGFDAHGQDEEIQFVNDLSLVMTGIFLTIATAALITYAITIWGVIAAHIRDLKPDLSLLRLLGIRPLWLVAFPTAQALLVVTPGIALGFALATVVAAYVNATFLTDTYNGRLCVITVADAMLAILVTGTLVLAITAVQCFRLSAVAPSDALREGSL